MSVVDTVRRLRLTASGEPRSSSTTAIMLPLHVRRLIVSSGRSDRPGPPRRAVSSTCTTIW